MPVTGPVGGSRMSEVLRALIVEDSPDDAELIIDRLRDEAFEVTWVRVQEPAQLEAALDNASWDVVLCDHSMPRLRPSIVLDRLLARSIDVPLIIVSGTISDEAAVEAMRSGAQDYVLKDNLSRLGVAVRRELTEAAERRRRHDAEQRVHYLALHDEVTGLPNRPNLEATIARGIDADPASTMALVVIAIDRMDTVRDAFGVDYGNQVLREVVARIKEVATSAAVIARISETQVGILCTETCDGRAAIADPILQAFVAPFEVEGHSIGLRCRVGIAAYPRDADRPGPLIQRAEASASRAHMDRRVMVYEHGLEEAASRQLGLLSALQDAIVQDDLALVYQPQIDLRTGAVRSFEALVRWTHPQFGAVPPSQFVPLLEQAGDVHELTRWVLKTAAQQQHLWLNEGLSRPVSVNLSAQDLTPSLSDLIFAVTNLWALAPDSLQMEVTESAILADFSSAMACLGELADAGVWLSLDDFGTGQSSLSQLRDLPVDELKIDRSFVVNGGRGARDRSILEAIVRLGAGLGMHVVAEGIETDEELNMLLEMHCETGQGYLLGRPMPPAGIPGWVATHDRLRSA